MFIFEGFFKQKLTIPTSFALFCFFILVADGFAALPTMSAFVVADSEESFARRIYSYDIQIDSKDNVHIIYSKPVTSDRSYIYYLRRLNGVWQNQVLVSTEGFIDNKCTFLAVDENGLVHVCYTKFSGSANGEGMYYRTINNGVPEVERFIYAGTWWGRMQLGDNGYPIFVSSSINWQTDNSSKLVMHTTSDGQIWNQSDLNLPRPSGNYAYIVADFLYSDGVYHVTYGDSAYLQYVWRDGSETQKEWHIFHDLHYATSTNGVTWTHFVVDGSHTLRNSEYWTALALDNGKPLIGMFNYAEYDNKFSRGTSAKLSKWNGSSWEHKIITNQIYPDTHEGMGIGLVVNGPGDYFGAWDFSPWTPQILPPSIHGNIGMRRSGSNGKWENVAQLDAFSLEGTMKLRIQNGRLYSLSLADYMDAKLYFREFSIAAISTYLPTSNPPEGGGAAMPSIYMLLLKNDRTLEL